MFLAIWKTMSAIDNSQDTWIRFGFGWVYVLLLYKSYFVICSFCFMVESDRFQFAWYSFSGFGYYWLAMDHNKLYCFQFYFVMSTIVSVLLVLWNWSVRLILYVLFWFYLCFNTFRYMTALSPQLEGNHTEWPEWTFVEIWHCFHSFVGFNTIVYCCNVNSIVPNGTNALFLIIFIGNTSF